MKQHASCRFDLVIMAGARTGTPSHDIINTAEFWQQKSATAPSNAPLNSPPAWHKQALTKIASQGKVSGSSSARHNLPALSMQDTSHPPVGRCCGSLVSEPSSSGHTEQQQYLRRKYRPLAPSELCTMLGHALRVPYVALLLGQLQK
jgi:hypothetical protein